MITTDYTGNSRNQGVHALDLANLFTYHAPKGDQQERYVLIRDHARAMAEAIVRCCPPSADTTAAIRKLRECVMTANAAIACNE